MEIEERRKLIIDYIRLHPYRTKEEVVNKISDKLSRVPAYQTIGDLIEDGSLKDERKKKNSRNHRLFVDDENPLVTVPQDLKSFEKAFIGLVRTAMIRIADLHKQYNERKYVIELNSFEYVMVFEYPRQIFANMTDSYMLSSSLIWPNRFFNVDIMKEFYSIIFSNISQIQLKWSCLLKRSIVGRLRNFSVIERLIGNSTTWRTMTLLIKSCLHFYSAINMRNEIEQVLDILWKITYDIRNVLSGVNGGDDWCNKYNVDDWRVYLEFYNKYQFDAVPPGKRFNPATEDELVRGDFIVMPRGIPSFLKKAKN